jgi:hypothetical protein
MVVDGKKIEGACQRGRASERERERAREREREREKSGRHGSRSEV